MRSCRYLYFPFSVRPWPGIGVGVMVFGWGLGLGWTCNMVEARLIACPAGAPAGGAIGVAVVVSPLRLESC